jgi:radical SAM superfamily enzyme YgiQ (UPF0313 family)
MHDASLKELEPRIEQPRPAMPLRVWLADLTYTQQTVAADIIPNAIGGIATFAESQFAFAEPVRLFKYPEKLAAALTESGAPDIIGFSNYIWNASLSLAFAQRIKEKSPETVVVLGGPNYPLVEAEQERYLRAHPEIDFYIIKEGELAFFRLLEALAKHSRDREQVKRLALSSIHSIVAGGGPVLPTNVERLKDLTVIPSPYTTGKLDEFFDGMLLPIIQTNRGCPFGCTFCVEGVNYYNKIYRNSGHKVAAELDYIGRRMAAVREKGGRNDLFIADSNFGMYKEDLETCRQLARTQSIYKWPEYINVATGKNQKERVLEASKLINGALRLSGSVQSLDVVVLKNIKRNNISADGLMDLALRASEVGANSYSEIILGLPGETKESHFKTIRTVMDAGFTNIYLFQLMLLPGTELALDETKAKFEMLSRYRVLPRCYGQYEILGTPNPVAEIEEICVASNTLSFDDYLECRRLHLIVTIFYNDALFGTLLKLLRQLGLSFYRWIEIIRESSLSPPLAALFSAFERATKAELWDDRGALDEFIRQPGTVDKFLNGELGNNLLFVHKALAITQHVPDLADLARRSMRAYLKEAQRDDAQVLEFVDDAVSYHANRMTGIFGRREAPVQGTYRYELKAFDTEIKPRPFSEYRLPRPSQLRFELDASQRSLIERYEGIYGDTLVGVGRIVSKVYVRKLFRHAIDGPESAGKSESELSYRVAGLQN